MNNSETMNSRLRVRSFVDFWNFQLSLRDAYAGFKIDWQKVGPVLAREAGRLVDASLPVSYEGLHVYGSFDPDKETDVKFRGWFNNTLDKMPGVHGYLAERQRKRNPPKCPHCQTTVDTCPACTKSMLGTEEKGVDTQIVTDIISLAWIDAYDVAVLVSSDRDFVPVAEFLQSKGRKIVHGAFPPKGGHLSQKCWANLSIPDIRESFRLE